MNKPSERIVVFVTPAQKRAISATADELGISLSELMRRAVTAFSATSDQVRAASIVDRLNARREPDALALVLRKAAKPLRHGRASPLKAAGTALPAEDADADAAPLPDDDAAAQTALAVNAANGDATHDPAVLHAANGTTLPQDAAAAHEAQPATLPAPLVAESHVGDAAREIAQAVARLAAQADEASQSDTAFPRADAIDDEPLQPLSATAFARTTQPHGDADARHDGHSGGAPEDGKFA